MDVLYGTCHLMELHWPVGTSASQRGQSAAVRDGLRQATGLRAEKSYRQAIIMLFLACTPPSSVWNIAEEA